MPFQHDARAGGELQQQLQLGGGERHGASGEAHLHPAGVDGQVAEGQDVLPARGGLAARGGRVGRPAQQRTDAGHEYVRVHGLHHVVVGPGLQTGDDIEAVAAGGHHQHRHQAGLADPAAQPDPVEAGQHHVEDQQVEAVVVAEGLQPGQSVGRSRDPVAVAFEGDGEGPAHQLVVLDQQHADRRQRFRRRGG